MDVLVINVLVSAASFFERTDLTFSSPASSEWKLTKVIRGATAVREKM
jgi:hypothetical protein